MTSDFVHEVEVAAEAATIYEAITTRQGEAAFWVANNTLEPQVGSIAEFRFKEAPVPLRMRVEALEPGRRVKWTCVSGFPGWQGTTVTWTLNPGAHGTGTKLEFRMGNLTAYPEEAVGSVNYTWGQIVARLKSYAETGKPQPFLE